MLQWLSQTILAPGQAERRHMLTVGLLCWLARPCRAGILPTQTLTILSAKPPSTPLSPA